MTSGHSSDRVAGLRRELLRRREVEEARRRERGPLKLLGGHGFLLLISGKSSSCSPCGGRVRRLHSRGRSPQRRHPIEGCGLSRAGARGETVKSCESWKVPLPNFPTFTTFSGGSWGIAAILRLDDGARP